MNKITYVFIGLLFGYTANAQIPALQLVQVAAGFLNPVDIRNCGDGRIFIVQEAGKILIMDKSGNINPIPFLDITSKVTSGSDEQGLLTLAFSPNYKEDSTFYVNYITGTGPGYTVLSRFHVSADSNIADSGSEKVLLTFSQPYANHNGSTLMFGHDGYLYDTQGDGGGAGDPLRNGQNFSTYLAKILRLDVSHQDTTYTIPPDNPFIDTANAKPELWAIGVRNPWRCSFDRLTGDLWIGDVGQDLYEEVDFQPASSGGGQDYGWNCYEGYEPYITCNTTRVFTFPVFAYSHSATNGCCVIGGYVYRGAQFSNLFGRYFCTDFCSGRFLSIIHPDSGIFITDTLQSFLTNQYCTFGEDNNGEIYVAGYNNGIIYRLADTSNCRPVAYILPDSLQNCSQVTLNALYGDSLNYKWYNTAGLVDSGSQYTATATGWYKVKVSKAQFGCENISDSVFVKILADTLIPCNCTQGFCVNDASQSLSQRFNPFGGLYTGRGITLDTIFTPSLAGVGPDTITYTYINSYGCISADSVIFQVNDIAHLIDSFPKNSFCRNDAPVSLTGFIIPSGGIYTGTAVTNNYLNVASILGYDTVYYSYTDSLGCNSTDSLIFQVNAQTPLIDSAPGISYCNSDTPVNLSGFIRPSGGVYDGTGVSNNLFNPASLGSDTVYYTYTNTYGCISSDTFAIVVSQCTAIENLHGGIQFNIFPNPNSGSFNVEIQSGIPQKVHLTIADETGRICFQSELISGATKQTAKVEVPGLSKGVYALRLTGNHGFLEKQLIIE